MYAVVDPGFPIGGAKSKQGGGGYQHIIWSNFPENCMKMKIILSGRRHSKFYYVDPTQG